MTKKNTPQERKDLRELKEGQALFYKELVAKKYDKGKAFNIADTLEFDAVIFPIETQRRIVTTLELHPQNNATNKAHFIDRW
jgi:acetyl-CoA carboxylase carboxyltransferase component